MHCERWLGELCHFSVCCTSQSSVGRCQCLTPSWSMDSSAKMKYLHISVSTKNNTKNYWKQKLIVRREFQEINVTLKIYQLSSTNHLHINLTSGWWVFSTIGRFFTAMFNSSTSPRTIKAAVIIVEQPWCSSLLCICTITILLNNY